MSNPEQNELQQTPQPSRGGSQSGPEPGHGPAVSPAKKISGGRVVVLLVLFLIIAVIVVISGILPRVRARTKLADQTNALAAPAVIVAPPKQGQPTEEVVLPGNVQAFTDSPMYARTSGYLAKWYFDIGARVKKGQLLALIDSPEIDQQLAQAQADLATAVTNAENAGVTSKRYQDLLKADAVSKQDTDNFTTQANASNTAVKSAQANMQRVQQLVDFEKVYAPFDGVITARNVDIGQLITAGSGSELYHMAAVNLLRVYINVPQVYSRAAKRGVIADLTFAEYPGRKFQGKVVRTSDQIDPVSRTLLVEVEIDNRKGELLPGAYTEVHLKLNENAPSYIIPVSALIFRSEGLRVGTVVDGNTSRLVPIVVGQDDGRVVQVVSGLDAGSQVIQDPPDSLVDGETVHVIQPEGGSPPQPGSPAGGSQK
jgi:RND family efflux transporter MFP subunit